MTSGLADGKPVEIYCAICALKGRGAVRLVVRTNKQNGSQFLGCENFPECTHTQPIPESVKMRLAGQKEMF